MSIYPYENSGVDSRQDCPENNFFVLSKKLLFISEKATNFQKIDILRNVKKNRMYSHFPYMNKIWKIYMYVTFTHGSERGGMTTCIVIPVYLKTVFDKNLHVFKTMYEFF